MANWLVFFLFIFIFIVAARRFFARLREISMSSNQAEQKLEREIRDLTHKKHQTPQDAERVARVIEALAHGKKEAAAASPRAPEHRLATLADAAHARPKTESAPARESATPPQSSMPQVALSPSVFEAPPSSLLSGGGAVGAMAVQSLEQKLDIAGLMAGSPTPIPVPDIADRALLVRLKSQKSLLVAPPNAPASWLDQQLQVYDYVCIASPTRPRVLRRFEDFIADQMFK